MSPKNKVHIVVNNINDYSEYTPGDYEYLIDSRYHQTWKVVTRWDNYSATSGCSISGKTYHFIKISGSTTVRNNKLNKAIYPEIVFENDEHLVVKK